MTKVGQSNLETAAGLAFTGVPDQPCHVLLLLAIPAA